MMSGRRKRVVLSIDDKLKIVEELKRGTKANTLAQEYGVGNSTISDIKKSAPQLEAFAFKMKRTPFSRKRKVMRAVEDQALERVLYRWFLQQRLLGAPMSGPIIIEKAKELNGKLNGGHSKFKASNRWLCNFKERYGIRCLRVARETSSIEAGDWVKQSLQNLVEQKGLVREQVYNCDETGLSWRCLPWAGTTASEDRVTLLACTNASGMHKLNLTLVGKAVNPNCFKHFASLPVQYVWEENAWMTCDLFKDWFFNEFVPSVSRHLLERGLEPKALLVLDVAPCHPDETYLQTEDENFTCLFLPADNLLLQPMGQGILACLKLRFRLLLLQKTLSREACSAADAFNGLTLADAAGLMEEAWQQVSISTLRNAWNELWPGGDEGLDLGSAEDELPPTAEISSLISQLSGVQQLNPEDIFKWLNVDSNDHGFELFTDEELVDSAMPQS
ncbi:Jerky protein homolog-like [Acipenser ruthenus]|uniref:Jerky protein homolog-like n=1 Tax=Acipenser ruthenus TaxID=7906 RepID=A0A444V2Y2_ACIRT|nr:Jerky protein homolog-like [Acipenser ruthenus]